MVSWDGVKIQHQSLPECGVYAVVCGDDLGREKCVCVCVCVWVGGGGCGFWNKAIKATGLRRRVVGCGMGVN